MGMACAITGHRPARFQWKYDESSGGLRELKNRLREQIILLYGQGVHRFYVGGALGVDLWAGEILLQLKEQQPYREIELVLVLPFDGYDLSWDDHSRSRMDLLIRGSANTLLIGSGTDPKGAYRDRNRYMVDHANCLLAVYDNDRSIRSGTGMTVHYAQRKKLPILLIHPDTHKLSLLLPDRALEKAAHPGHP